MSNTYTVPEYLKNPYHPVTVNVIGAGGTGSLLIGRLARLNEALKMMDHPGLQVSLYDPDIVEEFNIGRQNFTLSDVGLNKATCLINKVNMAYGLQWESFGVFAQPTVTGNIFITCVDNADYRVNLSQNKETHDPLQTNFLWIDCGNGKDFGQVVLTDFKSLRTPTDIFGDLVSYDNLEAQGTMGCSYRDKLNEQDLFINDIISAYCSEIIWSLFRDKTLDSQGVIINTKTFKSQPIKIKI